MGEEDLFILIFELSHDPSILLFHFYVLGRYIEGLSYFILLRRRVVFHIVSLHRQETQFYFAYVGKIRDQCPLCVVL